MDIPRWLFIKTWHRPRICVKYVGKTLTKFLPSKVSPICMTNWYKKGLPQQLTFFAFTVSMLGLTLWCEYVNALVL